MSGKPYAIDIRGPGETLLAFMSVDAFDLALLAAALEQAAKDVHAISGRELGRSRDRATELAAFLFTTMRLFEQAARAAGEPDKAVIGAPVRD